MVYRAYVCGIIDETGRRFANAFAQGEPLVWQFEGIDRPCRVERFTVHPAWWMPQPGAKEYAALLVADERA